MIKREMPALKTLTEAKVKPGLEVRSYGPSGKVFEVYKNGKRLGTVEQATVTGMWRATSNWNHASARSYNSKEDAINSLD